MAELFANFEINRTPRWPRLARLLAASFVVHLILVAAAIYVPTVRRALHLASMFSNADYVYEDYATSEIRERAQIINLAGKLYYPPGYFSTDKAAPERIAEVRPRPTPAPPKPRPTPTPTPEPTPEPTPAPSVSPSPDASPEVAQKNPTGTEAAEPGAVASGGDLSEEEQKAKDAKAERDGLDKLAAQNKTKLPPKINAKPFKDLLAKGNAMKLKGDLDLSGAMQITVEADRNEDGTLTNMVLSGGNANNKALKELAKDLVQALSASHALAFLEGASHLRLTLSLDEKKISATVVTSVDSESRAADMARVYTAGIIYKRIEKRGVDEGAVWRNTSVSASGKKITVNFEMPRTTASTLLAKQVPPS